jgi:SAM-dependent methyltransferase
VGVVPGGLLNYFARNGRYQCSGVDFSPKIVELREAFQRAGVEAELVQADFLQWNPGRRFDVVYSVGFVEHFDNYREVVERHWDLVAEDGILVLVVPTATPAQWLLRRILYTDTAWKELWTSHNRDIMSVSALRDVAGALRGSEILVARPAGEFFVAFGPGSSGVRPVTRFVVPLLEPLTWLANRLGVSSRLFSPSAVVAARKRRGGAGGASK